MNKNVKNAIWFGLLAAVIVVGPTVPMLVREPSTGHFVFGGIMIVGSALIVFLVALSAGTIVNKKNN